MMQSCASAAKLRAAGPFFGAAHRPCARSGHRHLGSLSAAQGCQAGCPVVPRSVLLSLHDAGRKMTPIWQLAGCDETPKRDEQLACQRHDHGLARAAAAVGRSRLKPLGQGAVLLEPEKTPSKLDHATPDAGVAGARKTLLAPPFAALIRRAGQPGIAGDGLAIAQMTRQDLVDQHVRRLDANADDPRNRRTIACGPFSPAGAAASLRRRSCSIARICSHTRRSRAMAAQFRARVLRQRRPFRRAQPVELFRRLAQGWPEAADAEASEMAFIWFTIRVRSVTRFSRSRFGRLRVLFFDRRDRRHAAMALLAAQPAEKGAHQQFRVEAISLRAPVLARHRDACRMDNVSLDVARPQPARQPEAVASGLISDDDALDLAPGLARFVAPTMQDLQQRLLVGIELLERLAFNARNNRRDEPPRLAHLDHGDECAILLEGGEGPARIKRLRHGALRRLVKQRRRCHTLAARPIASLVTERLNCAAQSVI